MSLKAIVLPVLLILILGSTSTAFAMGGGRHHRRGGDNGGNGAPQTDVTGGNAGNVNFSSGSDTGGNSVGFVDQLIDQSGPLASVPEPATTLLVGSSLVGLLALARRRK